MRVKKEYKYEVIITGRATFRCLVYAHSEDAAEECARHKIFNGQANIFDLDKEQVTVEQQSCI